MGWALPGYNDVPCIILHRSSCADDDKKSEVWTLLGTFPVLCQSLNFLLLKLSNMLMHLSHWRVSLVAGCVSRGRVWHVTWPDHPSRSGHWCHPDLAVRTASWALGLHRSHCGKEVFSWPCPPCQHAPPASARAGTWDGFTGELCTASDVINASLCFWPRLVKVPRHESYHLLWLQEQLVALQSSMVIAQRQLCLLKEGCE